MEAAMFDVRSLVPRGRHEPARRDYPDPFLSLRRDMDRLFEDLWRGLPMMGGGLAVNRSPSRHAGRR
jgi:hypothetical protein